MLDAEAFVRDMQPHAPSSVPLLPARAPTLLLLVADPGAADATRRSLEGSIKTLVERQPKWASLLPSVSAMTLGAAWAGQQLLPGLLWSGSGSVKPVERKRRRWRSMSLIVSLLVIGVFATGGYYALRSGRSLQTLADLYADPRWRQCTAADFTTHIAACSSLLDAPSASPLVMATVYNQRAAGYFNAKQFYAAIGDYNEAIQRYPTTEFYYLRGNAYFYAGMYLTAIQDYSAALRLNDSYALAYCWRGISEIKLEKFDEAFRDADRAVTLDASLADAWNARGAAYFHAQYFAQAATDFQQALILQPLNRTFLDNLNLARARAAGR